MKPIGTATRGTTNPNRLRRVDRYLVGPLSRCLLDADPAPVVVDLGFGRLPTTAVELYDRLTALRRDIRVLGIEIDPERVAAAHAWEHSSLRFLRGGFELPLPAHWPAPTLVRAMNVLRQYDEADVEQAWERVTSRLAPGGRFVEGTCDELGRICTWVTLSETGPQTLTLSLKLDELELPSKAAERLPKALIHHNVEGKAVHQFLAQLDRAWQVQAPLGAFGARQRWVAAVTSLKQGGLPVLHDQSRWRLGEITVPWNLVAP